MVFPNTIWVSLRLASVPLRMSVELNGIHGNEWYFQIPFGVSLRLASVPLRTSVVLNGIQIVMNGISKYHSGIIETASVPLKMSQWY